MRIRVTEIKGEDGPDNVILEVTQESTSIPDYGTSFSIESNTTWLIK